ncbi:MAG: hypothetical protein QOH81_2781 [Sphingomonadales bacterium]|jgi:hypothetical protein|nr:hypothetical protein [Sphingomonadales bacterium]
MAGSGKRGGSGHPLPASDEARHGEIPETLEREKGRGDDEAGVVQPDGAVNPDGAPYLHDDAGRGAASEAGSKES